MINQTLNGIFSRTNSSFIVPLLTQIIEGINEKRDQIENFTGSWNVLQTPFEELSIGFSNLFSLLPIGLAIGYVISILHLKNAIRARSLLHYHYPRYYPNEIYSSDITTIAPIWLDPIKKKIIFQSLVLIVPILLIFSAFVCLIVDIWYRLEPPIVEVNRDYNNDLKTLETLHEHWGIKFNKSDYALETLPLFFGSSSSTYKEMYLIAYILTTPIFLFFIIVWQSYKGYWTLKP